MNLEITDNIDDEGLETKGKDSLCPECGRDNLNSSSTKCFDCSGKDYQ